MYHRGDVKGRKNLARHHREVAVLCAESLVRAKLEGRDAGPVQRSGKCSRGLEPRVPGQDRDRRGYDCKVVWILSGRQWKVSKDCR